MEIVLQCLLRVLPACLAAALAAAYFVHMLQLCSYQWGQYRHYIQKNAKTIFGLRRMVALLLVLPFVLQHRGADSGWYYALLLLAYSGLNRRKFVWEICRNRLTNSYNAGVLVLRAPPSSAMKTS